MSIMLGHLNPTDSPYLRAYREKMGEDDGYLFANSGKPPMGTAPMRRTGSAPETVYKDGLWGWDESSQSYLSDQRNYQQRPDGKWALTPQASAAFRDRRNSRKTGGLPSTGGTPSYGGGGQSGGFQWNRGPVGGGGGGQRAPLSWQNQSISPFKGWGNTEAPQQERSQGMNALAQALAQKNWG